MFKKKKQDDWYIDEYEEEEQFPPQKKKEKIKKSKKSLKKEAKKAKDNDFVLEEPIETDYEESFDLSQRKPNPLNRRDTDSYSTESFDDYVIEEEKPKIPRWKWILPLVFASIIGLGIFGYINTDFDENGNAYIVSLQTRYERKYVKQADKVLQVILDENETLDIETAQMPQNYIQISTSLQEYLSDLKEKTNTLSKYVGVPKEFETYHSQLINFSLSTQKFVEKLIANYNDENYEAFRESGIQDYYNSLDNLLNAREDVDVMMFSSIYGQNNGGE